MRAPLHALSLHGKSSDDDDDDEDDDDGYNDDAAALFELFFLVHTAGISLAQRQGRIREARAADA